MGVEPWVCDLDEECGLRLAAVLVKGGSWTGVIDAACVRAELVLSPLQVAVAANMAALAHLRGQMVTRSLYTEILFNLSPTKNITQSLTKFGINDQVHNFLVCHLVKCEDSIEESVRNIPGEIVSMDQLVEFTKMEEIKKVYKLSNVKFNDDKQMLDLIISRLVTKNFVSH